MWVFYAMKGKGLFCKKNLIPKYLKQQNWGIMLISQNIFKFVKRHTQFHTQRKKLTNTIYQVSGMKVLLFGAMLFLIHFTLIIIIQKCFKLFVLWIRRFFMLLYLHPFYGFLCKVFKVSTFSCNLKTIKINFEVF